MEKKQTLIRKRISVCSFNSSKLLNVLCFLYVICIEIARVKWTEYACGSL